MTLLFWDIDGTLLSTARGGVLALEDACLQVTGQSLDLQAIKSDGVTDHQLAVRILEWAGVEPTADAAERFLRRYEAHLPERLPQRQGRVLDNVYGILTDLQSRPDVSSMLLTGNTRAGADAKLTHYGLRRFFDGGAFSEDTQPRVSIAVRALAEAQQRHQGASITADRVFVIGDTPHDIDCARAIGARSITVATGVYRRETLIDHGAWVALDRFPGPEAFAALLDLAPKAPSA